MDFDKSKVYTSVNADALKIGSKVVVADTLRDLKERVEDGYVQTLTNIRDDDCINRFEVDSSSIYSIAYLVSEPEEKKLKWTDLKVKDVIKRGKEQAEVTYINEKGFAENEDCHICIGCFGIMTDDELEEWEKVE